MLYTYYFYCNSDCGNDEDGFFCEDGGLSFVVVDEEEEQELNEEESDEVVYYKRDITFFVLCFVCFCNIVLVA